MKRLLVVMAALGLVGLLIWHFQDWLRRQESRHNPEIAVKSPPELANLPIALFFPARRWMLWLPGASLAIERRIERQFPEVWHAYLTPHFFENRVDVLLQPRRALAIYKKQGLDGDGVLFPLPLADAASLPAMNGDSLVLSRTLGHWLLALEHTPWLWSDIAELKQDNQGFWTLVLRSGPVLVWGTSDENVPAKAAVLQKIMARAGAEHGGALRADLRFFREGRIIVQVRRPLHA